MTSSDGGNEASWVTQGYDHLYTTFPRLRLVILLNGNSTALANQEDWRLMLRGSTSSLAIYQALLAQTRFRGVIAP
ncbi:MAG: hypothetical protein LH650_09795 [Chloroflexi bacterium]|nr:hypothetical protein [Chloroflexota bacterium]